MERKRFCVTFFLRRARTNKAGLAPIFARITTNGISKEVYIQCSVPADKWNQSKECATGRDVDDERAYVFKADTAFEQLNKNPMKREIIKIDEWGGLNIPTDTAAIWMTEAEIVELSGTTAGAVYAGIKTILKENALRDFEVCKCIRLDSGNSADVYNMEVVFALAFRQNTYPASVFRKWLVKTATAPRCTTPPIVIQYKNGLLN